MEVFSICPNRFVAVPAILFVVVFDGLVPVGLGFAGGAMRWMVAAQVVPDALTTSPRRADSLALVVSAAGCSRSSASASLEPKRATIRGGLRENP